jgi:hypothetical protein
MRRSVVAKVANWASTNASAAGFAATVRPPRKRVAIHGRRFSVPLVPRSLLLSAAVTAALAVTFG